VAPATPQEETATLLEQRRELHEQLFEAAQIQRKLSGPRSLRRGDFDFGSEVFAARFLPGDFTAIWELNRTVVCAVGDIAGKGVAAGMWFTYMVGLLQRYASAGSDPAKAVAEVNRNLCGLRPGAPFTTLFIAQMNCERGEMTYCNAGHFPPVLLRDDGGSQLLDVGGPLLGALADAGYESATVTLRSGDSFVAYSDGILECRNAADEEFGLERLIAEARDAKHLSSQTAVLSILAAVQDFSNGSPLCDDMSLMIVQRD
jgi:sigma-B regulation protein RsbU (phosphoserine phosphatase)